MMLSCLLLITCGGENYDYLDDNRRLNKNTGGIEVLVKDKWISIDFYVSEIKIQLKNNAQAAKLYATENGDFPPDCWETMKDEDYLKIEKSITRQWKFGCNYDNGDLSATSTNTMPGGYGNTIHYNMKTGKFSGWQQND